MLTDCLIFSRQFLTFGSTSNNSSQVCHFPSSQGCELNSSQESPFSSSHDWFFASQGCNIPSSQRCELPLSQGCTLPSQGCYSSSYGADESQTTYFPNSFESELPCNARSADQEIDSDPDITEFISSSQVKTDCFKPVFKKNTLLGIQSNDKKSLDRGSSSCLNKLVTGSQESEGCGNRSSQQVLSSVNSNEAAVPPVKKAPVFGVRRPAFGKESLCKEGRPLPKMVPKFSKNFTSRKPFTPVASSSQPTSFHKGSVEGKAQGTQFTKPTPDLHKSTSILKAKEDSKYSETMRPPKLGKEEKTETEVPGSAGIGEKVENSEMKTMTKKEKENLSKPPPFCKGAGANKAQDISLTKPNSESPKSTTILKAKDDSKYSETKRSPKLGKEENVEAEMSFTANSDETVKKSKKTVSKKEKGNLNRPDDETSPILTKKSTLKKSEHKKSPSKGKDTKVSKALEKSEPKVSPRSEKDTKVSKSKSEIHKSVKEEINKKDEKLKNEVLETETPSKSNEKEACEMVKIQLKDTSKPLSNINKMLECPEEAASLHEDHSGSTDKIVSYQALEKVSAVSTCSETASASKSAVIDEEPSDLVNDPPQAAGGGSIEQNTQKEDSKSVSADVLAPVDSGAPESCNSTENLDKSPTANETPLENACESVNSTSEAAEVSKISV